MVLCDYQTKIYQTKPDFQCQQTSGYDLGGASRHELFRSYFDPKLKRKSFCIIVSIDANSDRGGW
jgi:hypothetical protein